MPSRHENNFDLIRLVAAVQVVWYHGLEHLVPAEARSGALLSALDSFSTFFPGVPVFFFLSGFLISMSLERSPSLGSYALNRAIRIYPALWACLAASLAVITLMGGWGGGAVNPANFGQWIAAQASVLQFYNGGILSDYGTGAPNGALWTISVELQFYALLPALFLLLGKPSESSNRWKWLGLALAGFLGSLLLRDRLLEPEGRWWMLAKVSPLPYLYAFAGGVAVRAFLPQLKRFLEGRFLPWLILHVGVCSCVLAAGQEPSQFANAPHPATVFTLCGLTFSAAWTLPGLARRLLRSQDISYGIYIYHMVVINALVEAGRQGLEQVLLAVLAAALCGLASWIFVERNALRLKPYSMRSGSADGGGSPA